MEDREELTLNDLAGDIENWKLLYLDRIYPDKYKEKVDYFMKRVNEEKANKNSI
jgi:hypothetical protein